jgi:hypothetical protein
MKCFRPALLAAAATCFALLSARPAAAQKDAPEAAEGEAESGEEGEESDGAADESEGEDAAESESTEVAEPGPEPESEPAAAPPAPRPRFARLWLGLGGTLDLLLMPAGDDLCKLEESGEPANDLDAYCTNPNGSDFPTRASHAENELLLRGESGAMEGGLTTGNLRLLFLADYAPAPTLLIGTRIGYVFGTYPGKAAGKGFPWIDRNLHAELRATYVFGKDPLARIGFAPMAFVAGGAGEFDARLTRYATLGPEERPVRRPVDIWIIRGPWFAAAGGGVRYQFSPRVAFNAALRLNAVFGSPMLFTAGPDLGISYGF